MTTMAVSTNAQQSRQRPWWSTLIAGIVAVVVGGILLWAPAKDKVDTYQVLVAALGLWWIISGILDIVHMFQDHTMWGWKLFIGIVSIIAGMYVLEYPVAAGVALPRIMVLIVGIWALMYGGIMLVMAFKGGGWAAGILGAIELFFGFVLIGNYGTVGSGLAFLWAAAFCAFVGGIFLIFIAFRQRRALD
jgi:uncharacterized membrane protein HdeD (DUF308 family)